MCLNQTYSCETLQFKITSWWGQGPDIREFKLHPDTTSTVPPGHPFPPSSRVPVSDPSRAGMTARVQHFTMYGNFDIILDHLSCVPPPLATLQTPGDMFYVGPRLIDC